MKEKIFLFVWCTFSAVCFAQKPQVRINEGVLQGVEQSGIKMFLGVPFAKSPVGDLRWKEPQPAEKWEGIRIADAYGNDPVQMDIFGDMLQRGGKQSEDCLYLNIWTPAKTMNEHLPVFIYFNGGGLVAGSGSEPRYDGRQLARKGIVSITANYRESIFGYFAHPQLSQEAKYKGSGNYGFLDQVAAIKWVWDNIAKFGGDPSRITICGESAGSWSVSVLIASPLSRNMIHQAIGSSGALLGRNIATQKEAENKGVEFAKKLGKKNIVDLRAMSAEELKKNVVWNDLITCNLDNYFLPKQPDSIYAHGQQANIPILIGCNDMDIPGFDKITELWTNIHVRTSGCPVYRYYYTHPRPAMRTNGKIAMLAGGTRDMTSEEKANAEKQNANLPQGAVHSADIEYSMATLHTNRVYDWQPDDYVMSDIFINYFANFIKTGNPNGLGLTEWIPATPETPKAYLHLDVQCEMLK